MKLTARASATPRNESGEHDDVPIGKPPSPSAYVAVGLTALLGTSATSILALFQERYFDAFIVFYMMCMALLVQLPELEDQ